MVVKKILYWTALVLSLGLLAIIIYFSVSNGSAMKAFAQGGTLHTQEELDNAYNEGVNESKAKLEACQLKIDSYKSQIAILTDTNKQLEIKVENLEKDNILKQAKIDDLTNKLNILKTDFATISNENIQLKKEIEDLQNEILELKVKIDNNNTEINELNARIQSLEADIEKYKALIQKLKPENMCIVTLSHNNQIYDLKVVTKGDTLSGVLNPEDTPNVKFLYWLKDGKKVEDINSEVITSDVTYTSNIAKYCFIQFYVDGVCVLSDYYSPSQWLTFPVVEDTANYVFDNCWYKNSVYGTENRNYYIQSSDLNIKFYAKLKYYHTVNFYDTDNITVLKSISVLHNEIIESSQVPVINQTGCDMLGWKSSSTVNYNSFVDLTGYKITEDTKFYPQVNNYYTVTVLLDNETYFDTKYYVGKGLLSYLSTPQLTNCQFLGYYAGETKIDDINTYEFTSDTIINIKYKLIRATASEIKFDGNLVDVNHNAIAGLGLTTFAKSSNYTGFTFSCNYNVKSTDGSVDTTIAINERFDISGGWFYYGIKNKFLIFESSINLSFSIEFSGCTGDVWSSSDYPMFVFRFADEVAIGTTFTDVIITFY